MSALNVSRKINLTYRVALICGGLPLCVGVFIFLLWVDTRWNWLMAAGIYTIYGGIIIFLVGVISLIRFGWLAFRSKELSRRRIWLSMLGCATLLFSNFIVAGGIMLAVGRIINNTRNAL